MRVSHLVAGGRARRSLALTVAGMIVIGGCGRAGDDQDVRRAVQDLLGAAQRHDGSAACRALAPRAAESLESGGKHCADEITRLGLRAGAITAVQVWGERAQARLAEGTVFLARFPDGWKVTAAGCRPQPEEPYDCEVEA